jgi:hypothetical protein
MILYAIIILLAFVWGGFALFSPKFNHLDEHKQNDLKPIQNQDKV